MNRNEQQQQPNRSRLSSSASWNEFFRIRSWLDDQPKQKAIAQFSWTFFVSSLFHFDDVKKNEMKQWKRRNKTEESVNNLCCFYSTSRKWKSIKCLLRLRTNYSNCNRCKQCRPLNFYREFVYFFGRITFDCWRFEAIGIVHWIDSTLIRMIFMRTNENKDANEEN